MSSPILRKALDCASPVGYIPPSYPFIDLLCKEAFIGYEDCVSKGIERERNMVEYTNEKGEKSQRMQETSKPIETTYRRWFVVYDTIPYPRKHKTPTGRTMVDHNRMVWGTLEHSKFCAIIDYIEFRAEMSMKNIGMDGKLSRVNILNVAIGKDTSVILPNGDRMDIGKKIEDLKRKSFQELCIELSGIGMKKYASVSPQGSAGLPTLD